MPNPGDIGLVPIPGQVGFLIRVGQWLNGDGFHDFEHAFVYVGNGGVVEAEPGGARYNQLSHYGTDIVWLHCPQEHGAAVAKAALGFLGTPYSFLDYFALAALRLRLPSVLIRRYVRSTKHMICSQLAAQAAENGGWYLSKKLPQDITPGYLTELALAQESANETAV